MALYDFTRLKRLMIIYRVVQVALLGLLLFMAFNFQKLFALMGLPALFTRSVLAGIAFQMVMFYPTWLLAKRDATVEFESSQTGTDRRTVAVVAAQAAGGGPLEAVRDGFLYRLYPDGAGCQKGQGPVNGAGGLLFCFSAGFADLFPVLQLSVQA